MPNFSAEQLQRYSRHILLPEFSGKAQRALLGAHVLLIGAGGLGSPAALYLAAAGVGHLTIIDADEVELSNLQRQIAHTTADLGRNKAESAGEKLAALNPDCKLTLLKERFNLSNARDLVAGHDVIIDGSDNFPTRFLANDACYFERKPLCYGAVNRFEGQASLFLPGGLLSGGEMPDGSPAPCYRCLFPAPPPPGLVPTCAEAGVLGTTVGQIGLMQASEAIKVITGVGETLAGRLLLFDALATRWREIRLKRSKKCPLCGEEPTITKLRLEEEPDVCERT